MRKKISEKDKRTRHRRIEKQSGGEVPALCRNKTKKLLQDGILSREKNAAAFNVYGERDLLDTVREENENVSN